MSATENLIVDCLASNPASKDVVFYQHVIQLLSECSWLLLLINDGWMDGDVHTALVARISTPFSMPFNCSVSKMHWWRFLWCADLSLWARICVLMFSHPSSPAWIVQSWLCLWRERWRWEGGEGGWGGALCLFSCIEAAVWVRQCAINRFTWQEPINLSWWRYWWWNW